MAEFSICADTLQAKLPELLSLQLAQDGIVTVITNKARNGRALGHDYGDLLLQQISERLRGLLRDDGSGPEVNVDTPA